MGFFSSIGNFISNNVVGSAIQDITSTVGSVVGGVAGLAGSVLQSVSPLISQVVPIAQQIAPFAGGLIPGLAGNLLTNSLSGNTNSYNAQDIALINQNQQALAQQNAQIMAQLQQSTTDTSNVSQPASTSKITENLKQYWYYYTAGLILISVGIWYFFFRKPSKKSLKW